MRRALKLSFDVVIVFLVILGGCVVVQGCNQALNPASEIRPAASLPQARGVRHPLIKIKMTGTKAMFKDLFPQLQHLTDGTFVRVVPGIEAELGPVEITISQLPDGRVMIDLGPNGQRVRIDKDVLMGLINIHGVEKVSGVVVDEQGADVMLEGSLIRGVRLVPAE